MTGILLCFSHLRWNFVFQRPQHLMTRFAQRMPIVIWEEPEFVDIKTPGVSIRMEGVNVRVVTPQLPHDMNVAATQHALQMLLHSFLADMPAVAIRWYYTPMMFAFSANVKAARTVYDCMDELSAFLFAPPELLTLESRLLEVADLVFTGGHSLYEAKRKRHRDVRPFPSSVDVCHFARSREHRPLASKPPHFGFYGVIDERMDLGLLRQLAEARPDWIIEIIGPVVKIDPAHLPRNSNLRYLGMLEYDALPEAIARWDVALIPFAMNEATRFISPTKTPEYLAAGRPVVSTPIADVVRHYGNLAGVRIANTGSAFVEACDAALELARGTDRGWRDEADALLAATSWDDTATRMMAAIDGVSFGTAHAIEYEQYDVLVVGAGFAGAVIAERLAADSGKRVLVIDRRPHIAGNAYDEQDAAGILVHRYGPHIFHTNSGQVFEYLSRFTRWHPYEHRVLAEVRGKQVPIPINRTTLNSLFDAQLKTDSEVAAFFAARAEPIDVVKTSEDVVVGTVGRELYQLFFQGYTRKQWGLDASKLDKSVTARVPIRTSEDDRYFSDRYQIMPEDGFTAMFMRMLDHPNITVRLSTEFDDVKDKVYHDQLVYSGPIDEYFDYCYGHLPYRSLRFEHRILERERYQAAAVVNFPDEAVPYTRVTEFKQITGQRCPVTSVAFEYPSAEGPPYYPIPRPENQELFKKYEALALLNPNVVFIGRLANYRYYNMDQVVGQALATYQRMKARIATLG
ncbi:UDP-galactopyranose mutase [Sphingomonas sp. XXL09]|uniref:UDP-galactopyranose mutase n=1 Tax=Sphingomonas sp. XXL09 TaxID=3457787 RepID=UPI00406BBB72